MEHSKDESEIILASIRNFGGRVPDFIKNAPDLLPGLDMHYRAFWELTTCRAFGFGVGPIPWTAMKEWAELYYTLDEPDFEYFVALLSGLDSVYMKWIKERKPDGGNNVQQPPTETKGDRKSIPAR